MQRLAHCLRDNHFSSWTFILAFRTKVDYVATVIVVQTLGVPERGYIFFEYFLEFGGVAHNVKMNQQPSRFSGGSQQWRNNECPTEKLERELGVAYV